MDQAKGGGGQQLFFLAATGRFFYEGRGVPLAEKYCVALANQPLAQEGDLRTLAGAIHPLHNKEPPGILMQSICFHDKSFFPACNPASRRGCKEVYRKSLKVT